MAYVIERMRKRGVRYMAIYLDENGRYKSAGTYDTQERAQAIGDQHERHIRLRLAETSPADKATITVRTSVTSSSVSTRSSQTAR